MNAQLNVSLPAVAEGQQQVIQPTLYLNWHMQLANGVMLDNDSMRLVSFDGHEQLSSPYTFTLSLHGDTDFSATNYNMKDLIGRPITVGTCLRDGKQGIAKTPKPVSDFKSAMTGGDPGGFSFLNGMVTGFSISQPGVYTVTMKPALWRLMLTNHYRIHVHKSVRTAIEAVLTEHNVEFNTAGLQGSTVRTQDWLQAGETDYEFVQRLMSKANAHYYFVHGPKSHTVVFSNKASYPPVFEDDRKLSYSFTGMEGLERADTLESYQYSQEISHTGASGVFTRQEAAWESCDLADVQNYRTAADANIGDLPFRIYKIWQYGGSSGEATEFAAQTADMIGTAATELDGSCHNPEIRSGHRLELSVKPRGQGMNPPEICPYLEGNSFVFTQIQHQATLDGGYNCKFKATESDGLITPFNPQVSHQGTVLAKVVAHGHGTSPVTWKYYEKNNFDPEQHKYTDTGGVQKKLNAQGVYVRFTTDPDDAPPVWIKLSASMQTCPEITTIVSVARASDESELPEIQQIVQANGSKVVNPCGWTANTHVGSSYSTNYGDSKSIRFGLHSVANLDNAIAIISKQYETGSFRDSSYSQGGSYSYSTSESGRSGMLSTSESFGNTYSHHEGDISDSYSDITESTSVSIIGTTDSTSTINTWSKSHHHNKGTATSFSQTDGLTDSTNISADVKSTNTTRGTTTSVSTSVGAVSHTSTNKSTTDSTSVNVGAVTSHSTNKGTVDSTSINEGAVTSHSTNKSTTDSTSINEGAVTSHSTNKGAVTSYSTNKSTVDSHSTNEGAVTSHSHNKSTTKSTSTNDGKITTKTTNNGKISSTTHNNAHVSSSTHGTSSKDTTTMGSTVRHSFIGSSMSLSLTGSTMDLSLTGSVLGISIKGQSSSIDITGAGINLGLTPGVVSLGISGVNLSIPVLDLVV